MGADLGYAVGYFRGRPFVERLSRFLRLSTRRLARAELLSRHGAPTIFVARFVSGLRHRCPARGGAA
jgi:membrane protein DedA with SNARE-associated domain